VNYKEIVISAGRALYVNSKNDICAIDKQAGRILSLLKEHGYEFRRKEWAEPVNYKMLITKAGKRNLDVVDGEIDGFDFQARQILNDLEKAGHSLYTKGGRRVQVTIRGE